MSKDGVYVDQAKIEAILNWEKRRIVTEIRSFLGLVGYYLRLVEGFSMLVAPLTQLMRKGVKFEWDEKCERSFQEYEGTLLARFEVRPTLTNQIREL